jgi:undecaprenol kinase
MNARKFLKSFSYAFQGIITASQQQNMKFHLVSAFIVLTAAILTKLSIVEWAILCIVIGVMFSLEMINTSIEAVVDLASPEFHPLAKVAKDVAAGAVLVFAVFSVIIGVLIFFPKWF